MSDPKPTKAQIAIVLDALAGLISDWNDLAEDGDRGRDNQMLVLTIWDDGSGRIGTAHSYNGEDSHDTFFTVTVNPQGGFNTTDEMVEYLCDWDLCSAPVDSPTPLSATEGGECEVR